jgi:hypothetical protein
MNAQELVERLKGARHCALPSCRKVFMPTVGWQKCCSEGHARRLRWERRKDRINKALRLVNAMDSNDDT